MEEMVEQIAAEEDAFSRRVDALSAKAKKATSSMQQVVLELLLAATSALKDDPLSMGAQEGLISKIKRRMGWRCTALPPLHCHHALITLPHRSLATLNKIYIMCREFVLAGALGCTLGVWGGPPMCSTGACGVRCCVLKMMYIQAECIYTG